MRPLLPASLALLPLLALLAGCAGPAGGEASPSTSPGDAGPTTDAATTAAPSAPPEHRFILSVQVLDPEPKEVGVPFPHGAWCLAPSEWALHAQDALRATAEVRQVERGKVLWVRSSGAGTFNASVDLAGRAPCQTLRYDPWSVDPDPADGTVEVQADGPVRLVVEVREQQGACQGVTRYEGETAAGWTALPGTHTGTCA